MTPDEQIAAIREQLAAGDYRLTAVPEIHTLLARIDALTAERDKELNDHRKSVLYYEDQLETFRGHLEKLTAELAAANARADEAADARQAAIVAWLRERADEAERRANESTAAVREAYASVATVTRNAVSGIVEKFPGSPRE